MSNGELNHCQYMLLFSRSQEYLKSLKNNKSKLHLIVWSFFYLLIYHVQGASSSNLEISYYKCFYLLVV